MLSTAPSRWAPTSTRTWGNLADAYRFTPGRAADAREAYTRAIQLLDQLLLKAPGDLDLSTRRVVMLAKRGDCQTALSAADPLREAASKSSIAAYRLGVAYEVCGRRDDALDAMSKAISAGASLESGTARSRAREAAGRRALPPIREHTSAFAKQVHDAIETDGFLQSHRVSCLASARLAVVRAPALGANGGGRPPGKQ